VGAAVERRRGRRGRAVNGNACADGGPRFTAGEEGATLRHYDMPAEVFAHFLDPWMKYSPGLFTAPDDDLSVAQERKMAFIAEQLGLTGGGTLLDVGCGWGALMLFVAERYGCRCVGITPAGNQAAWIAERARARGLADRIRVERNHVQDAALERRAFDAVSFVGSIVHMDDKTGILRACYRALRSGGRVYVSETCFRSESVRQRFGRLATVEYVRETFGWGDMAPVSVLLAALEEAGLVPCALTDLTPHFKRTIDCWLENIRVRAGEIDRLVPGAAGRLVRYLEISNAGWGFTTRQYAITARKGRRV